MIAISGIIIIIIKEHSNFFKLIVMFPPLQCVPIGLRLSSSCSSTAAANQEWSHPLVVEVLFSSRKLQIIFEETCASNAAPSYTPLDTCFLGKMLSKHLGRYVKENKWTKCF